MGIPRSNSPSTVSHRAIEEGKKVFYENPPNVETSPSKQKAEEQIQVPTPTNNLEEGDPLSTFSLKEELKTLLSVSNGCTNDKRIVDIIAKLSERNPCRKGFAYLDCFPGDYRSLTIPHYPGRIKASQSGDENIVQYTLGKLSFNIFQPNELICTVKSMRNPVHLQHKSPEGMDNYETVFSYHIVSDLIIHTDDGDLEATLISKGFCRESAEKDNRMKVTFTGGTLVPGYGTSESVRLLALWKKTFANAYEKANRERTVLGWIYLYCLKFFLGLVLPTDSKFSSSSRHENAFHFDIKRPPKGFFDVLYLDDDMRISKGNRGTITIQERTSSNGCTQ